MGLIDDAYDEIDFRRIAERKPPKPIQAVVQRLDDGSLKILQIVKVWDGGDGLVVEVR